MPDSHDDSRRPPRDARASDGVHEHDAFVVDTRRSKGNRRASPDRPDRSRRPDDDGAQAIPVRGSSGNRPRRGDEGPGAGSAPVRRQPSRDQQPSGDEYVYVGGPAAPGGPGPRAGSSRPGLRRPGSVDRGRDLRGGGPGGRGPGRPGPRPEPHGAEPAETPSPRRTGRGKKIVAGLLVFFLLWMGSLFWAGRSAWNKVDKVDAIPAHLADSGSGTNTLIVGSDGRGGLSAAQRKSLGTGQAEGQRTDSIMVLHTGGGKPTLMSIPRDSYVPIPGHMKNKINASFSMGGPQLLIKTIEQNTGIRIDHYMEIGFGGFASVVDAVGGVRICVARDMNDHKAHINLKKGCQTLNGPNALGYVRARYSDPEGDIGRAKRQRQFLGALMKKIGAPSNLLVPWKLKGLGESGAQGLAVDKDMSMFQAMRTMWTLKGFSGSKGNSVVVPLDNDALPTPVGEAVEWDPQKSAALFKAIRDGGDTTPYVTKSSAASPTP